jgi:hypothetical protein
MKLRTLTGIFLAAAAVGIAHYAVTGMEDVIASAKIGVAGGWGALAMDVYRTLRNAKPGSGEGSKAEPERDSGSPNGHIPGPSLTK